MLPFNDISYAQGEYNMDADSNAMIMMKASGGDGISTPFYLDDQLVRNYANAVRLNKIPFMYHVLGNNAPLAESGYFLAAVSPFAKGDGYALDIEPSFKGTVQDVLDFVTHFKSVTNCYPWVYIDRSLRSALDWKPVFSLCSEWIAAPDVPFTANIPNVGVYVAQQGPIVDGHDTDMYFGSEESLRKYTYGYELSTPTVVQLPVQTSVETPATPVQPTTPIAAVAPVLTSPSTVKHIDIIPATKPAATQPTKPAANATVETAVSLHDIRYILSGYKTYMVTIIAILYGVLEQGYQLHHWTNFGGAWTWVISAAGLAAVRSALALHVAQILDAIDSTQA